MDNWNGQPYDDDPNRWARNQGTHPVVRFDNIRSTTEPTARLIAESQNEGFKAVKARQMTDERGSFWRVQLDKVGR